MRVFVCIELDQRQMARLRECVGEDELFVAADPATRADARAEFDLGEVVLGNPPAEWVASSPALRWLQLESVGFGEYTGLDWPVLGERVVITNLGGFFAQPVAESALAGILALGRGIDRLVELRERRVWVGDALRSSLRTLDGASVVLFGHGAINRRLGELLAPFGCRVTPFASGWSPAELDAALAGADVVVCTVPDTPSTRGVFGRERLALLGRSALFANFGRGSVVDERALAEALTAGRLGGAVIDVTNDEPLPAEHAFWSCPNTILTQHTGGGSASETDGKIELFARNLDRYRRGEPLLGTVDFRRGY